jgi:hypothetical protein
MSTNKQNCFSKMYPTKYSIIYLILFGIIIYSYYGNYFNEQLSEQFISSRTKLDSIYSHFPKRYITTNRFGGRFGNKVIYRKFLQSLVQIILPSHLNRVAREFFDWHHVARGQSEQLPLVVEKMEIFS